MDLLLFYSDFIIIVFLYMYIHTYIHIYIYSWNSKYQVADLV